MNICFYKHEDDVKEANNDKEVINIKVKECEDQIKTLEAEIVDLKNSIKSKEMELEAKTANEKEQSIKVKKLMKINDIQRSDLKYGVKTKEIGLNGKIEKLKKKKNYQF